MKSALLEKTSQQLKSVMKNHLEEIRSYIEFPQEGEIQTPEIILTSLQRLSSLCDSPYETASYIQYQEAKRCLACISYFLEIMHQHQDIDFKQSAVGIILEKARMWTEMFYQNKWQLPISEVWALIDPVKPDTLTQICGGIYEACWWKPVPIMDIEILYRTAGIIIQQEAFEPDYMAEGIAVRFSVI